MKPEEIGMTVRIRKAAALLAAIIGIGALTPGLAADSRLDDAQAHLVKARELVKAALPSSARRNFIQAAQRAEDLINQAIREIDLAKAAADKPQSNVKVPPQLAPTGHGVKRNPSGLIQLNPQPEPPSQRKLH